MATCQITFSFDNTPHEYTAPEPVSPAASEASSNQPQSSPFPPPAVPQPVPQPAVSDTSPQGNADHPQPADPHLSIFYPCQIQKGGACRRLAHADRNSFREHLIKRHEFNMADKVTEVPCTWGGCPDVLVAENIARHVLCVHMGVQWCFSHCPFKSSRKYKVTKHCNESEDEQCRAAMVQEVPGPGGVWR
ncbi:hypothetical protein BV22DRAFT_64141 [Leucogyrophana mollusca]|uniref:Uncharacterized protein n=1 Tax=Leucogyrophana mollusca TaxID=85980 RepID=A0ACB8BWV3_9AGAM|nr:hypothetical protein BV22DRAFT_64141 [Leucogyrophana mollusca]